MLSSIGFPSTLYYYLYFQFPPPSPKFLITPTYNYKGCILKSVYPIIPIQSRLLRPHCSVQLDRVLTSGDEDEDEMSDGFFEAIEELGRMTRDPSDVLQQLNDRLSPRELQLVLLYFSQEGRDSWCALEVFDWLRKENRLDQETIDLMVSIMCAWLNNLILADKDPSQIVDLLLDMDCVGLNPGFSIFEKAISLFCDLGKYPQAVSFVQDLLARKILSSQHHSTHTHRGGPAGYLAWKMMEKGNYRDAVKLVIHLRETGLNPQVYSYLIAMTAVVKELNQVTKGLRKLKAFARAGFVAELDKESIRVVDKFQSDILDEGVLLSTWAVQEGNASVLGLVHEKLLAMYICAGRGVEAERQLWEMKLIGKEVERYFYDIVLAICASQRESGAVSRLLTALEVTSCSSKKKTLTWLLRGHIKGGNFGEATETVTKMLDLGLRPEKVDRIAVLEGLRKRIQQPGYVETYLKLCKHLSDAELIGPCLIYMSIKRYRLWIVKMI